MNLDNNKKELKVSLFYVTPPVDSQLDKIKDFVAAKEGVNKDEVRYGFLCIIISQYRCVYILL